MRITSWNCQHLFGLGKDIDRCLGLLSRLDCDLVTLQECHRPDAQAPSIIFRGENDNPGTAVVSTSASLRIEPIEIPSLHPTVVPVVVRGREPFVFVGVWTHEPFIKVAWEAMTACAEEAERRGLPVVAAGDFNISQCVVDQRHRAPQFIKDMRDKLGLVSAWHHSTGEALGEETRPTYYHRRKESDPFHIDYCFLPETWTDRLTGVEVGSFEDWPQSDHRPLTVALDI